MSTSPIYLCMYRTAGKRKFYLREELIRIWLSDIHTHCELWINGISYSSSPRDVGVRKKRINYNIHHWDFIEISLQARQKQLMLQFLIYMKVKSMIGKAYSYHRFLNLVCTILKSIFVVNLL